jgi:hypothetical protein
MTAALASQEHLTVGASGRIVTHTLMSSGHLAAAVTTAQDHAARLDRETGITTPESQFVYGSLLLRGALAAAQHGRAEPHRRCSPRQPALPARWARTPTCAGRPSGRSTPAAYRSTSTWTPP